MFEVLRWEALKIRSNPLGKALSIHVSRSHRHNDSLLLVDLRPQLEPVEDQKGLERGMADALVAVYERMIRNERVPECCSILMNLGI